MTAMILTAETLQEAHEVPETTLLIGTSDIAVYIELGVRVTTSSL